MDSGPRGSCQSLGFWSFLPEKTPVSSKKSVHLWTHNCQFCSKFTVFLLHFGSQMCVLPTKRASRKVQNGTFYCVFWSFLRVPDPCTTVFVNFSHFPISTTLASLAILAANSPNSGQKRQSSEAGAETLEKTTLLWPARVPNLPSSIFKHNDWFYQKSGFLYLKKVIKCHKVMKPELCTFWHFSCHFFGKNRHAPYLYYFSLRGWVTKGPWRDPLAGPVSMYLAEWGDFAENGVFSINLMTF